MQKDLGKNAIWRTRGDESQLLNASAAQRDWNSQTSLMHTIKLQMWMFPYTAFHVVCCSFDLDKVQVNTECRMF